MEDKSAFSIEGINSYLFNCLTIHPALFLFIHFYVVVVVKSYSIDIFFNFYKYAKYEDRSLSAFGDIMYMTFCLKF